MNSLLQEQPSQESDEQQRADMCVVSSGAIMLDGYSWQRTCQTSAPGIQSAVEMSKKPAELGSSEKPIGVER
jgi:hypothetical protein